MVLLTRDIRPKITLETYVGYPSLKRIAIPLASTKDGKSVGLIQKIRDLDPMVAKNYIFIDSLIIDRAHSKVSPTGESKRLLSDDSIDDLKNFFSQIKDLISDSVVIHATKKGGKSKFLKKSKFGLKTWQSMTLQNGGWLVKPQILLRDLKGFEDASGFPINHNKMKFINPCKYYNKEGLKISNSNFNDFVRSMKININKNNEKYYKGIFNLVKNLKDSSNPFSKLTGSYDTGRVYRGKPVKKNTSEFLEELTVKQSNKSKEIKRINVLIKITGLSREKVKNKYTITPSMVDDEKNKIAKNLIKRVEFIHKKNSELNREKACKLITVLNDLQERKGWHNRITPMDSVDTPKKANYVLNGKNDKNLESDLKAAEKNIKSTIDLLKVCTNKKDPTSCIHPSEKENLGLYGRNRNNKFDQKSWIEPSEDMRSYVLLDVPLTFYQKTNGIEGRIGLVSKFMNGIKRSGIDNENPLNNVHSFSTLSRFGEIVGLPMINPNETTINFAPDANLSIDNNTINLRNEQSKKIKYAIESYYEGANPLLVINELKKFSPISSAEIKNNKDFWQSHITESMVYPHQLLSYPKDAKGDEIRFGCLSTHLMHNRGSTSISYGDLVLLDGKNELIRWKSANNDRKSIQQVHDEILKKTGDKRRADPSKWKWTCVSDNNLNPSYLNDPNTQRFKIKKVISRRAIDLYYRKEGENNVTIAVDNDSVANAIKDIAIDASNVIHLGGITQLPNYVTDGSQIILTKNLNWEDVRKGGSPQRRLAVKELKSTIENIQRSLGTTKQFNIIKDLTSNEKNISINATSLWFDPKSKVLIQRRKDISKENYGLPKSLFIDPVRSTVSDRKSAKNESIIALETNLMDTFSSLGVTPKKK